MSDATPFTGFPKEGLQFLKELQKNNNPVWFNANKDSFLENLIKPSQSFVESFGGILRKNVSKKIQYDTRTNGSGSIFRIYRDIRFSKDKTPYKTHVGILFWQGDKKKMENPGIYFHLEPQGAQIHVGHYGFSKTALEKYRKAVIHKKWGTELEAVVKKIRQTDKYIVNGEYYKTIPRGFDPDHERAAFLKYNGLFASSPWIAKELLTQKKLPEVCMAHCKYMVPVFDWLIRAKI